jgi:SAM-dependent methyltransferase
MTHAVADPPPPLAELTQRHLEQVRRHYDEATGDPTPAGRGYRRLLAHYYNLLIPPDASVLEIGCGDGELLAHLRAARKVGVDLSERQLSLARQRLPGAEFHRQAGESLHLPGETFDVVILSDTLNLAADVVGLLERVRTVSTPRTRLLVNYQNNLWRPLFALATALGLRRNQPQCSWLSRHDVAGLLALSGWESIKVQPRILWPFGTPLLAPLFNRWLAPLLPAFCLAVFTLARPRPAETPPAALSVSVVVPARNEAGNIEAAVRRTPEMGAWTELIFVEGHSTDETWAQIERLRATFPERRIKTLRQSGRGKGNAVRDGFAVAEGELLMILDADLTMPPEELPKFYAAVASGRCEFANGSRLVYPMEKQAMRFLNMIANKTFGLLFSWMLGQHVKDTLCGTKVLRRSDYERVATNRAYFGDFDPFGDFDLLFGADKLNLRIADIPIRYRDRTYGTTNIHRWRHGWLLLRMVLFAARKLKFV